MWYSCRASPRDPALLLSVPRSDIRADIGSSALRSWQNVIIVIISNQSPIIIITIIDRHQHVTVVGSSRPRSICVVPQPLRPCHACRYCLTVSRCRYPGLLRSDARMLLSCLHIGLRGWFSASSISRVPDFNAIVGSGRHPYPSQIGSTGRRMTGAVFLVVTTCWRC